MREPTRVRSASDRLDTGARHIRQFEIGSPRGESGSSFNASICARSFGRPAARLLRRNVSLPMNGNGRSPTRRRTRLPHFVSGHAVDVARDMNLDGRHTRLNQFRAGHPTLRPERSGVAAVTPGAPDLPPSQMLRQTTVALAEVVRSGVQASCFAATRRAARRTFDLKRVRRSESDDSGRSTPGSSVKPDDSDGPQRLSPGAPGL